MKETSDEGFMLKAVLLGCIPAFIAVSFRASGATIAVLGVAGVLAGFSAGAFLYPRGDEADESDGAARDCAGLAHLWDNDYGVALRRCRRCGKVDARR